jgi:hypothetical protein
MASSRRRQWQTAAATLRAVSLVRACISGQDLELLGAVPPLHDAALGRIPATQLNRRGERGALVVECMHATSFTLEDHKWAVSTPTAAPVVCLGMAPCPASHAALSPLLVAPPRHTPTSPLR